MDEIPDSYYMESVEQVRALADRLRVRIVELLARQPMTVAQLSEQLHLAHGKVHYHVRELEQAGLVRLVETREKGGILEKYYRAIAKTISVSPNLLSSSSRDETIDMAARFLGQATAGFLRALERAASKDTGTREGVGLSASSLFVTQTELHGLYARIAELLQPYGTPRGVEGEREVEFVALAYGADADEDGAPGESGVPAHEAAVTGDQSLTAASRQAGRAVGHKSRRREHTEISAGVTRFSRAEMEALAARGQRLDLYALGDVTFAADVPAELVDRVVGRARVRGRLDAPDAVRAVLERKEEEE